MKRLSGIFYLFILTLVLMASSCSPTKRLQEGEVFLRKQNIQVQKAPKEYQIGEEDLTPVLKQRTNRKILFFRFHLWVHNRINPERQIKSRLRRKYRIEKKIQKKLNENKDLTAKQMAEMRTDTITFRDWLSETVGEAPVALDSLKLEKSREQLSTYLMKHGFFNNDVTTRIDTSRNGKKASVSYLIQPNSAYIIDTIRYVFQDNQLATRSDLVQEKSSVKKGDIFDIEKLDSERERIQNYLNNKGYYSFSKEYVTFLADSTIGQNRVAIEMLIAPLRSNKIPDSDSTIVFHHPKFYIGNVVYHTSYDPTLISYTPRDTIVQDQIVFYYDSALQVKPDLLKYLTTFSPGDVYMKERVTETYRKLSQLSMFRSVNIQMKERQVGEIKVLDCHVYMTPAEKYAASFEAGVTHRDGLFGLSGSLVARDRNVFKRSENGEFRIVGAIETQQPLTAVNVQGDAQSGVTENLRFNTFEIGPELSVNFNHWFPFGLDRFTKSNEPKSSLTAAFNYQNRPDYERRLYQLKYGLNFVENSSKGSKVFGFADLSTININKSEAFDELLESLDDDFLSNSYQNHLIGSLSGVWEINKQKKRTQRTYSYNRVSAEMAGLLTRLAFNLANDAGLNRAVPDESGSYTISGIRFAEYLKLDEDFRWYFRFDEKNTTAFRLNGGIGVPLENLGVLPFEKSYYAGGSNGIRAWDPRTLGPGAYRDSSNQVTFNNVGEMKLLGSLEYRFKMTDTFEGALFLDAGNIWFLEANETRPNSEFKFDTFIDQIAVGGGLGFRFDFDFFLIRFDVAAQLKDPSKISGERWLWQPKEEYNNYLEEIYPTQSISYRPILNYNLGIGYPF